MPLESDLPMAPRSHARQSVDEADPRSGERGYMQQYRRAIYALLIVAACAAAAGRIMTVESKTGKSPFLSANDRSRWSAIRAIVDHGTFVVDDVMFRPDGKKINDWHSIDLVRHRGWDGKEHYYSSKPTLLTVALAGEYWLIKMARGRTIAEDPFFVGRLMLLITNVLPLAAYLWVLSRIVERYGRTDWGRLFVFAAACFGTFITTFAVTLNNHTLAATTALFAVHAVLHIWREQNASGKWSWVWFACAGLNAALTAANELPALALLALLGVALLWKSPLKTLLAFTPPVLVIAAAALGTNYYAHGSWKTPYAHRKDGPVLAKYQTTNSLEAPIAELNAGRLPRELRDELASAKIALSESMELSVKSRGERWMIFDPANEVRYAIVHNTRASMIDVALEVRAWGNWYDYPNSYWTDANKQGVDRGEPSRLVYAFHCLAGHHGIFSLTPIWLLAAWGVWLLRRREESELRGLAVLIVILTLVVLAFYIVQRPLEDRNYGGVSSGLRWMFWFIPLWLVALLPAADALQSRWQRCGAVALFAVSVFSAHYASLDPWSQPWIFEYWSYLGWIEY